MLFLFGFFAFSLGIPVGVSYDWVSVCIGIGMSIVLCFLFIGIRPKVIMILLICFGMGAILAGNSHIQKQENLRLLTTISENFSGKYQITGNLQKLLYNTDTHHTYQFKIDNFDTTSTHYIIPQNYQIHLLVQIPKNLATSPGDILSYQGKITPIQTENMDGFSRYMWLKGLYGKSHITTFRKHHTHTPHFWENLSQMAQEILSRGFPRDVAGLLLGVTIGDIEFLSSEIKTQFKNSGLMHILVVSGSNILFLILVFSGIFRYIPLPDFLKWTIIVLLLSVYATIVGWEVPVIRATLMGIIGFLAMIYGNHVRSFPLLI